MGSSELKSTFSVGDNVSSLFGEGKIVEIRESDDIHVVTLNNWSLANRQSPTLYLNSSSIKLKQPEIVKKTFEEDVLEQLEISNTKKSTASALFEKKEYFEARNQYFDALGCMRVRTSSTNFPYVYNL